MGETTPVNELFCYRDMSRQCTAECVAYLVFPPQDKEYVGQPWARCLDLLSKHRLAKHVTILASLLSPVPDPIAAVNKIKPPEVR